MDKDNSQELIDMSDTPTDQITSNGVSNKVAMEEYATEGDMEDKKEEKCPAPSTRNSEN